MPLEASQYAKDYYEEHRQMGLDYLNHGRWQKYYAIWVLESLGLRGKGLTALDVGCACGSIAFGFQKSGIRCHGVDLNNHMIYLGRLRFAVESLNVMDAVNLHLFPDEMFDLVHMHQAAEHFKPRLVPLILEELLRVLVPGGLLFTVHDTEELIARQARKLEGEDPTHICIRPRHYWSNAFAIAGFEDVRPTFESKLRDHPFSYFHRYDWEWLVLRKPMGPRMS